jgi:putative peptide zinc metalloprotease protein
MPYRSYAEGVVWLPEQAMVRARAGGFLEGFTARPDSKVVEGETLVRLYDPELATRVQVARAQVAELEARYAAQFVADPDKTGVIRAQLAGARAVLARAEEKSADLTVRAHSSGLFVVPKAADMDGRYFQQGERLGYVIGATRPLARVVVPQDAVDTVRLDTDRVEVRLADHPGKVLHGKIVRAVPAGEHELPSLALGTAGGGEVATDPRDPEGNKAMQRVFQFDVALAGRPDRRLFGEHVYVRFDHRRAPLALQWYRRVRLLFLSRFDV